MPILQQLGCPPLESCSLLTREKLLPSPWIGNQMEIYSSSCFAQQETLCREKCCPGGQWVYCSLQTPIHAGCRSPGRAQAASRGQTSVLAGFNQRFQLSILEFVMGRGSTAKAAQGMVSQAGAVLQGIAFPSGVTPWGLRHSLRSQHWQHSP